MRREENTDQLAAVSPDLRTLVSVGDSTDVYLFEIIDGGRDFRKIRTYSGKLPDASVDVM